MVSCGSLFFSQEIIQPVAAKHYDTKVKILAYHRLLSISEMGQFFKPYRVWDNQIVVASSFKFLL
jgi:hypothetical protein